MSFKPEINPEEVTLITLVHSLRGAPNTCNQLFPIHFQTPQLLIWSSYRPHKQQLISSSMHQGIHNSRVSSSEWMPSTLISPDHPQQLCFVRTRAGPKLHQLCQGFLLGSKKWKKIMLGENFLAAGRVRMLKPTHLQRAQHFLGFLLLSPLQPDPPASRRASAMGAQRRRAGKATWWQRSCS